MLDPIKLEKIILSKWTEFFDNRKLLSIAKNLAIENLNVKPSCQVTKLTLSHFEKQKSSFLLWIDYTILESKNNIISATSEIILDKEGKITHIKTIKN